MDSRRILLPGAALVVGIVGTLLFTRLAPSASPTTPPTREPLATVREVSNPERSSNLKTLRVRQLELHREVEAKWDALRRAEDELRGAMRAVERLDDEEARRAAAREATEAVRRELLTREIAELRAEATAAYGFERGGELGPLYWELVRVREWNAKFQAKEQVSRWANGSVEGPGGSLPLPKHRDHVAERLRYIADRFGPNSRIAQGWARALAETEERIARAKAPAGTPSTEERSSAETRMAALAPSVETARAALDTARADLHAVEDRIARLGEKP